ncbi:MAG: stage II sporulation protein R [Bacillota bacterium]
MYSRKRATVVLIAVAAVALLTAGIYWFANRQVRETYIPGNLIRFHVIANSDSDSDQLLKREVRDAILEKVGPALGQAENIKEAQQVALSNLPAIEELAMATIRNTGKDYPVRTEWGKFKFPTKSYGNFTLPAGEYEAVRVVIGKGEGANWWCVLFPPLCFVDISGGVAKAPHDASGLVPAMSAPVASASAGADNRPRVQLKIVELWRNSYGVGKVDSSASVDEAPRDAVREKPAKPVASTAPAVVANNHSGLMGQVISIWRNSRQFLTNLTGTNRT